MKEFSIKHLPISIWLVFSPLLSLFILIILGYTTRLIYGEVPLNDLAFFIALLIIILGLITGLISLIINKKIRWWLKLLMALTYIPIVIFSLLLSGF